MLAYNQPYPLRVWHLDDDERFEAPSFFSRLGEKKRGVTFATDAPGPHCEVVIGATWIVEIAYTNKDGVIKGCTLAYLTSSPNIESLLAYLRTL